MDFKKHLFPIAGLIILTFFFFFSFFKITLPVHDILTNYYPLAQTVKTSFTDYGDIWPLWTPYGFSGDPLLMKPILGYDSMLGIMMLLIPNTVLALKLTYVMLFLVAGISMYAFMSYLSLNKKFAFISALIYVLNGYVASKLLPWGWLTTFGGYSIIPLVFLFGTKAIREKQWIKNSIFTGIVFAVMLRLGPDMMVGLWIGLVFGLYMIFNLATRFSTKRLIKYGLVAALIIFIFFGLSAQRILPIQDYISQSSRSETTWEKASGRQLKLTDIPKRIVEPGFPKIKREGAGEHIGIIAFLLVIFAIYKKWKNKIVLFFGSTALLSILISNNTFNLYYLLWKYVPFFNSMRFLDRSLFIFIFSASVLAGIGANEFLKRYKQKTVAYSALVILILANLWLFNYHHYAGDPDKWYNPYEAIESNQILQYISNQPGIFRIHTWETRGIDWGTDFYNVPLKLEHIYRYDTTWYPPYFNVYLGIANRNPAKLWGMLNTKYITSTEKLNVSGLKLVKEFDICEVCYPETEQLRKAFGPYLYENQEFLPRAYVVDNAVLVPGTGEDATQTIYSLMLDKNFNPANSVIIKGKEKISDYSLSELKEYKAVFLTPNSVDQNSGLLLQQYVDSGGILLPDITKNQNTVTGGDIALLFTFLPGELNPIPDEDVIMHNFDKREIKLNNNKGFLVVSEKFSEFSGWKAGNKEILNANAMSSAILLEGDEQSIIFEYKPKSHTYGLYITLITLILVIGYFVYKRFKK